jgi:hypothetical protein
MHAMARFASFLLAVCLVPTSAYAWGSKGHAVVAELAERGLSPSAAAAVRALNYNSPLSRIASMPDDWRGEESQKIREGNTGPWHYSNIPNTSATFDRARDCKDDQCVVAAIERFIPVLKDKTQPREKRREALIYLVHFIGDIHQPMHAAGGRVKNEQGELESDHGGNRVDVRFLGVETNLHRVWDDHLPDWGPETAEEYVDYLLKYEMRGRPVSELQQGTVADWINESHHAAVHDAYDIGNGNLGPQYARENIGIVYERLLRGGLRLRRVLEEALGTEP